MIKFIIVIVVVVFGRWLEMLERENSYIFGCVSLLLAITFTSFDHVRFERTPTVIEKNLSSVLVINSGGEIPNRASGSVILQTGSGKSKKFNIVFHRRLEKYFPDWKERMDYQKKQEEFYKSAIKRKKEIKRIRLLDNKNFYTKEELDAMDYFNGNGFYQEKQDPKQKPNIFDIRQTFLLKMHNPILRNNFLNSLNSRSR